MTRRQQHEPIPGYWEWLEIAARRRARGSIVRAWLALQAARQQRRLAQRLGERLP